MAVVPADELGRADDAGQVLPRNAKLPVMRRPGGKDHRIVKVEQLSDRDIAAYGHVTDEIDACAFRHLVVAFAYGFERLMVRRDAEADEAIGNGIAIEDVDARPTRHKPSPAPRRCRSPPVPNRPPRNAAFTLH